MLKYYNELSYNLKTRIVSVIGVLILLGIGYVPFVLNVLKNPSDRFTWFFFLPICLLMTFFSFMIIVNIFCSWIFFDDEGTSEDDLVVREGFSYLYLGIDDLCSYRTKEDGGLILYYDDPYEEETAVKTINVPAEYDNIDELVSYLSEFLDDESALDAAEMQRQAEEEKRDLFANSLNDSVLACKEEEYKRLLKICAALNKIGIGLGVCLLSALFVSYPLALLRAMFISAAAYPLLLLFVIKLSKGKIRDEPEPTAYPSVFTGIIVVSVLMIVFAFSHFTKIMDYGKFLKPALALAGAFGCAMYFCTRFSFVPEKDISIETCKNSIVFVLLIGLLWSLPVATEMNLLFDREAPEIYTTKVIAKEISGGKNPRHLIYVSPWMDYTEEQNQKGMWKKIKVRKSQYADFSAGSSLEIHLHRGFLGIPYFDL